MRSFVEHDFDVEQQDDFGLFASVVTIPLPAGNRQGVEDSDTAGIDRVHRGRSYPPSIEVGCTAAGGQMLGFAGVRAMLPRLCCCCRAVTVSSPPCTRPRAKGRGVGRKVIGTVVVFDPGAKPLGCMGQSIRLEPGGVLIEWLVQMFRPDEWDVAVLDREGLEGPLRCAPHGGPSGRGRRQARSDQPPTCSGSEADTRSARVGR